MSYSIGNLGSNNAGTTFPDIIINTVEGTATNKIAGFAALVYNPRSLKTTVESLSQTAIPSSFPDAVLLRKEETAEVAKLWNFPLACSCPVTTPLPWTIIEATVKSKPDTFSWEFNIMRTLNFIGRNIIRIDFPMIDLAEVQDSAVRSGSFAPGASPEHTYLGAYYRDLVPRLIKSVSFYPRSSAHDLFVYSGWDLFMFNLVFGNERKELNDLMAGEDRFELCYDPFRVDGSAMGIASYKGIDAYSTYTETVETGSDIAAPYTGEAGQIRVFSQLGANNFGSDTLIDYFQPDDTMDLAEFSDSYRKNVWYEAPIAQNYWARHSIHSRRMRHYPKSIDIPLDILPFSYSLSSALPVAAISGECGYIQIVLHDDWLDRCFYLTKLSDVPPLHPIPQHLHYQTGDTYLGDNSQTVTIVDGSPLTGWVNDRSIGRFGDSEFIRNGEPDMVTNPDTGLIEDTTHNFDNSRVFATTGSIIGGPTHRQENLLPTRTKIGTTGSTSGAAVVGSQKQNIPYAKLTSGTVPVIDTPGSGYSNVAYRSRYNRETSFNNRRSYSTTAYQSGSDILSSLSIITSVPIIYRLSEVDPTTANQLKIEIKVHLFQIGFQTMRCITEWLTKLPNIYICTEWNDMVVELSSAQASHFEINNSLYQTNNFFYVIPTDANGIENTRYYPCHAINHEMPIMNKVRIHTMLDQGVCTFDWDMMNMVTPAYMGFQNPLLENIGCISFSPEVKANAYPLAYYDPNICGKIQVDLLPGEQTNIGTNQYCVNVRSGKIRVISTGVNGLILANLSLFRLIF